jgi:hypothetical protein
MNFTGKKTAGLETKVGIFSAGSARAFSHYVMTVAIMFLSVVKGSCFQRKHLRGNI